MKKIYEHKPHRLQKYNYSSNGSYFITICVKNKECMLGEIVAVDAPVDRQTDNINDLIYLKSTGAKVILSEYGKITEKYIKSSNTAYEYLSVDKYIIMPNHLHFILSVNSPEAICSRTPQHDLIPSFVAALKSLIKRNRFFNVSA